MVKFHTGEEQLSVTENGFVFGGTNGESCATSLGFSGGYQLWDLDSHKALLKAAGSGVLSYCFNSTDAFFYSPCAITG